MPQLVQAVRDNGGAYTINIARTDRIDQVTVNGVELYNPRDPPTASRSSTPSREADELATALPSVSFFDAGDETSVAAHARRRPLARTSRQPAIIYAAENHNHAAEILARCRPQACTPAALENVQFLNTVIGKMSGVIADADAIARIGLAAMTPATPRAILVEEFNRILISRITLPGFRRGIDVFVEKDDLLPFEEAKLYGHNAIHALIGYLADLQRPAHHGRRRPASRHHGTSPAAPSSTNPAPPSSASTRTSAIRSSPPTAIAPTPTTCSTA